MFSLFNVTVLSPSGGEPLGLKESQSLLLPGKKRKGQVSVGLPRPVMILYLSFEFMSNSSEARLCLGIVLL